MKTIIQELIVKLNSFENLNEENVKIHIVMPFLESLGYKREWFDFEYRIPYNNKKMDIAIKINNNPNNLFIIETKKKTNPLDKKSIDQLSSYLNSENIEWGLLTNGSCYILFNSMVIGNSLEKEVFRYCFFNNKSSSTHKNKFYLDCLNYDNLFKYSNTSYFRLLSDFRNNFSKISSSDSSFKQYQSTLYNYFRYLIEHNYIFDIGNINRKSFNDFLLFDIQYKNKEYNFNKSTNHKATVTNKLRHISSFYSITNPALSNPFKSLTVEDVLYDLELKDKKINSFQDTSYLTEKEINNVLNSFSNSRLCVRNQIIFLLNIYFALDINELQNLKITDFDFNKGLILINNIKYSLPPKLLFLLKKHFEDRQLKKVDSQYLFVGRYSNKSGKLDSSNFNTIISKSFELIDSISHERKKLLNPTFTKRCIIKQLFDNGCHIEDIIKLTGMTLSSLENYLSKDEIVSKGNLQNIYKKHPYRKLFQ